MLVDRLRDRYWEAADYRHAAAGLDDDHAVLLTGKPVPTPWDPALAPAMSARGLVVYQESVLADLIAELLGWAYSRRPSPTG